MLKPDLKHQAQQLFAEQGLPTRKLENWKYTAVQQLASSLMNHQEGQHSVLAKPNLALAPQKNRLVFADGHFMAELSQWPEEIKVQEVEPSGYSIDQLQEHPLLCFNLAFAMAGVRVHIPGGLHLEEPLCFEYLCSDASIGKTLHYQHELILEAGSQVKLTEYLPENTPKTWLNTVLRINLHAESKLTYLNLQAQFPGLYTQYLEVTQAADSQLHLTNLSLGAGLARQDQIIHLAGKGAKAELAGLYLLNAAQHADWHAWVHHTASDTQSDQVARMIADQTARGVYMGQVSVSQGIEEIRSTQKSQNLLLAKTAEIDVSPALKIDAEEVECSHAATVGHLDKQALHYLQTRGLSLGLAKRVLFEAFCHDILIGLDPSQKSLAQALSETRLLTGFCA